MRVENAEIMQQLITLIQTKGLKHLRMIVFVVTHVINVMLQGLIMEGLLIVKTVAMRGIIAGKMPIKETSMETPLAIHQKLLLPKNVLIVNKVAQLSLLAVVVIAQNQHQPQSQLPHQLHSHRHPHQHQLQHQLQSQPQLQLLSAFVLVAVLQAKVTLQELLVLPIKQVDIVVEFTFLKVIKEDVLLPHFLMGIVLELLQLWLQHQVVMMVFAIKL
jgi:hypothetical protein